MHKFFCWTGMKCDFVIGILYYSLILTIWLWNQLLSSVFFSLGICEILDLVKSDVLAKSYVYLFILVILCVLNYQSTFPLLVYVIELWCE